MSFRLPTEAEWEFAARGGNKSKHTQYAGSNSPDDVAWHGNNSGRQTHTVAQKNPNELGIYDMSGNVWEWCNDLLEVNYYSKSPSTDPQGPIFGVDHVLRGGSWIILPTCCRVSSRHGRNQDCRLNDYGFRLVLQ